MGNFIIDTRIKKLERIKEGLLKLKKKQRGDELIQVNQMIARLKRWNIELTKEKIMKTPWTSGPNTGNYKSRWKEEQIKNDAVDAIEFSILGLTPNNDQQTE